MADFNNIDNFVNAFISNGSPYFVLAIGKDVKARNPKSDITFDSVEISIKKNKEFIEPTKAYVYYFRKETETLYVWELEIKKTRVDKNSQKSYMKLIYENNPKDLTLSTILSTFSKWTTNKNFDEIPVFEAKSKQLLPLESTLVPIIKRKVLALIYQISSIKIEKNFDS